MTPGREMRARTILAQLTRAPMNKAVSRMKSMLGASNLTVVADGAVRFYFKGCRKFNGCEIKLNGKDLYDLTFFRITDKKAEIKEVNDVYAEVLEVVFHDVTGLYTHL